LYGVDVHFMDDTTHEFRLDETSASHLYRITQEALTNASRHGQASRVDIELRARDGRFSLVITDDGRGFAAAIPSHGGMGLRIMRYRAGMIGACFEIEAACPRGAVVRVTGERGSPARKQTTIESGERP
jgi:two-component system sensor kinase FixL